MLARTPSSPPLALFFTSPYLLHICISPHHLLLLTSTHVLHFFVLQLLVGFSNDVSRLRARFMSTLPRGGTSHSVLITDIPCVDGLGAKEPSRSGNCSATEPAGYKEERLVRLLCCCYNLLLCYVSDRHPVVDCLGAKEPSRSGNCSATQPDGYKEEKLVRLVVLQHIVT
jgi:hypothetical protein